MTWHDTCLVYIETLGGQLTEPLPIGVWATNELLKLMADLTLGRGKEDMKSKVVLAAIASLGLWSASASADLCTDYEVDNTDDCETPATEPSPYLEGAELEVFGNTYGALAKDENYGDSESDEPPGGSYLTLFWISEEDDYLMWNLAPNAWELFEELVMVIKQGNFDPDTAAWLLTPGTFSGAICATGSISGGDCSSDPDDVSHASLYGRGTPEVPEPATLGLLGIGLAGLGLGARRRRKI